MRGLEVGGWSPVNGFRDRPAGTLRLNVPASAARLVLPAPLPPFLAAYPEVVMDVVVDETFVGVLAAGCDAGIRYEERLEQDMIAVPIGPRRQRMATAASPACLDARGRPGHPRDLLQHACLRGRFASGAMPAWEFQRRKEIVKLDASGPLIVRVGGGVDLAVDAAVAGCGVIHLFEDWLAPQLTRGALEPVLVPWWRTFSGPSSTTSGAATCRRPCEPLSTSCRRGASTEGRGRTHRIRWKQAGPPQPWRCRRWDCEA